MTRADADAAVDRSKVLWGTQIWRIRLNIQHRFERASSDDVYAPEDLDEVCLDFHKALPVPEGIRKHRRIGSLWLNAANCGIRLSHGHTVLLRNWDSTMKVLHLFRSVLDFQLLEVQIDHPGGDTRFVFDREHTLTCFPANSTGGVSWVIVADEGDEFRFGPGCTADSAR
jgi:hypothetical protein